ncbi:hypothetical protein FRC07_004145, partial [Ceratobasidium sp. 392]
MFALYAPSRSERVPTFVNQRSLPKLPVPKLRSTIDRYLKSLEPLIAEAGEANAATEMRKRQQLADEFENGIGKLAQARLIDLDRASENNWLDDNLWIKKAYHEWRAPLIINSNWWLLFQDDPAIPEHIQKHDGTAPLQSGTKLPTGGEVGDWQIRRAAWLAARFMNFKERTDALFNITRIPKPDCDMLNAKPSEKNGRHIHVMLNDWCYSIQAYDGAGRNVGVKEIEHRLWEVVKDVQRREERGERAKRIGILTADERTQWAKNREHILTLSDQNRDSFSTIESALFTISLDPYTLPPSTNQAAEPDAHKQPVLDAQVRNTSSGVNGLNRWFDKSLTVSVESNARAGMNGEHSPCDALIPSIIVDYVLAEPVDVTAFTESPAKLDGVEYVGASEGGPGWKLLDWVIDAKIEEEIKGAEARAKAIVEDSDTSQLWFSEYAADWMRKSGGVEVNGVDGVDETPTEVGDPVVEAEAVPEDAYIDDGAAAEEAAIGRVASMSLISAVTSNGVVDEEIYTLFVEEVARVSADPVYWVRSETSYALGTLAKAVGEGSVEPYLLPILEPLMTDTEAHVRHASVFAIPSVLRRLSPQRRREISARYMLRLCEDDAETVKTGALQVLAEVIHTFYEDEAGPPSDLLDFFLKGEHSQVKATLPAPTPPPQENNIWAEPSSYFPSEPSFPDPDRALICAFNLPAVVLTLGPTRWSRLSGYYTYLANESWHTPKVRSTLAASTGEIARIIGPEAARRDVVPVWWTCVNKGERDAKIKAIGALPVLLESLGAEGRAEVARKMGEAWGA